MRDGKWDPGTECHGWWVSSIYADTGSARALSARLRRASSPSEVLAEPRVHELARLLECYQPDRLVLIVQTLGCVRESVSGTLPARLGKGEPPAMSQMRFQRLIRAAPEDLGRMLRRALPFVDHQCNVTRLGRDLFYWSEGARTRWCFEYFGAAAPESSPASMSKDPIT